MELTQLKTLRVVAKSLHFGKAAEELGLTQPAVSHQIRKLERQLGEELFIRTSRDVGLTQTGILVLDYAEDLLDRVESMKEEILVRSQTGRQAIRLIGNVRSLNAPFPQLLQAWRSEHDDVDLVFSTLAPTESSFDVLKAGLADCAFTSSPYGGDSLISVPWGSLEVSLLVAHDHALADGEKLDAERLQKAKWINFDKGWWSRRKYDEICAEFNISPKRTYETDNGSIVHGLVKEGSGIAILPRWGDIRNELVSGELVSVEPYDFGLEVTVFLTFRKGNENENLRKFIDFTLRTPLAGIPLIEN